MTVPGTGNEQVSQEAIIKALDTLRGPSATGPGSRSERTIVCPKQFHSDAKKLFQTARTVDGESWTGIGKPEQIFTVRPGPLAGFHPELNEPTSSLVLAPAAKDGTADLSLAMAASARTFFEASELKLAEALMGRLVETGLSRWNNLPSISLQVLNISSPFQLLLIDEGDNASSDRELNEVLKTIKKQRPESSLLVWQAAAHQDQLEQRLSNDDAAAVAILPNCQLAPLLAEASAVHVLRADAGLDAVFHGCEVHCHAPAFSAGFGQTIDHSPRITQQKKLSVAELAAATLIRMPIYLNIHNRQITDPSTAIKQLLLLRDQRMLMRPRVYAFDMPYWRRRAVEPFLIGPGGKVVYMTSKAPKTRRALAQQDTPFDVVTWGADPAPTPLTESARHVRLEDGFLRSAGLGAALHFPGSLFRAMDSSLHYDARGENDITNSLQSAHTTAEERSRADQLRKRIIRLGATKYMLAPRNLPLPESTQKGYWSPDRSRMTPRCSTELVWSKTMTISSKLSETNTPTPA